ncbi:MAG: hypothetical protein V1763_01110 [Parcubacteria group bacterium]
MKTKKFLGTLALGAVIGGVLEYFYNSATGAKNREQFQKKAKEVGDKIIKETGKLKVVGQKEYDAVVDNIISKYSGDDLMSPEAWLEIKKELKARWVDIQKELKKKDSV